MNKKLLLAFVIIVICLSGTALIFVFKNTEKPNLLQTTNPVFITSSITNTLESNSQNEPTYSYIKPKGALSEINVYDTYIDVRDKVSIKQYHEDRASYTNDIKDKNLDDVAVTITFNKLVSFEKLKDLIYKYDIEAYSVYTRYVRNGQKGSGGGQINMQNGITIDVLNTHVEEAANGTTACGYISMSGLVDSDKLYSLESNEDIYLVDTSYDGFFRGKTEKDGKVRNMFLNPQTGEEKIYYNHHVYAEYEEANNIKYNGEK